LKQRVLTAVVLLIILAAVLAAPGPRPFAVLLLIFAVLALFEWWRLTLAASTSVSKPVPTSASTSTATDPTSSASPLVAVDDANDEAGLATRLHQGLFQGETGWRLGLRVVTSVFAVWLIGRVMLDYSALGASLVELMGGGSEVLT